MDNLHLLSIVTVLRIVKRKLPSMGLSSVVLAHCSAVQFFNPDLLLNAPWHGGRLGWLPQLGQSA